MYVIILMSCTVAYYALVNSSGIAPGKAFQIFGTINFIDCWQTVVQKDEKPNLLLLLVLI